jgi:hypothetical protein
MDSSKVCNPAASPLKAAKIGVKIVSKLFEMTVKIKDVFFKKNHVVDERTIIQKTTYKSVIFTTEMKML